MARSSSSPLDDDDDGDCSDDDSVALLPPRLTADALFLPPTTLRRNGHYERDNDSFSALKCPSPAMSINISLHSSLTSMDTTHTEKNTALDCSFSSLSLNFNVERPEQRDAGYALPA
jgi:hypothetical protein